MSPRGRWLEPFLKKMPPSTSTAEHLAFQPGMHWLGSKPDGEDGLLELEVLDFTHESAVEVDSQALARPVEDVDHVVFAHSLERRGE